MKISKATLMALAIAGVAGCKEPAVAPEIPPSPAPAVEAPQPPRQVQTVRLPPAVPAPSQNDNLLGYFAHLRKLQAADLAREHDAVRQLYTASRSDYTRVRYAMVISIPGTPFYDDVRATDALDPLLKNPGADLHNIALLVNAQIQEQRKGVALQQKLDALRSLEKNMLERDAAGAKRK